MIKSSLSCASTSKSPLSKRDKREKNLSWPILAQTSRSSLSQHYLSRRSKSEKSSLRRDSLKIGIDRRSSAVLRILGSLWSMLLRIYIKATWISSAKNLSTPSESFAISVFASASWTSLSTLLRVPSSRMLWAAKCFHFGIKALSNSSRTGTGLSDDTSKSSLEKSAVKSTLARVHLVAEQHFQIYQPAAPNIGFGRNFAFLKLY